MLPTQTQNTPMHLAATPTRQSLVDAPGASNWMSQACSCHMHTAGTPATGCDGGSGGPAARKCTQIVLQLGVMCAAAGALLSADGLTLGTNAPDSPASTTTWCGVCGRGGPAACTWYDTSSNRTKQYTAETTKHAGSVVPVLTKLGLASLRPNGSQTTGHQLGNNSSSLSLSNELCRPAIQHSNTAQTKAALQSCLASKQIGHVRVQTQSKKLNHAKAHKLPQQLWPQSVIHTQPRHIMDTYMHSP